METVSDHIRNLNAIRAQVRHKALESLGIAYAELGMRPTPSEQETTIANAILGVYRTKNRDDQSAVEKVYQSYLVPVELSASYRMTLLYRLYLVLNEETLLCFTDLHKNIASALKRLKALLHDVITSPLDHLRPGKSAMPEISHDRNNDVDGEYSQLFSAFHPKKELCADLAKALEEHRSFAEVQQRITALLATLKPRSKSHALAEQLMCRATCSSLDAQDLDCLLAHMADYAPERGGKSSFCTAKDLRLLQILAMAFPSALLTERMLLVLEGCLEKEELADDVLGIMVLLGAQVKDAGGQCLASFLTVFKRFLLSGTKQQVKLAAAGLQITVANPAATFPPIVSMLKETLSLGEEISITALTALGHLAYRNPSFFTDDVPATLRGEIVRGLIFSDTEEQLEDLQGTWLDRADLPMNTQIKSTAMKTSVRWLAGLRTATDLVEEFLELLRGIMERHGDITGHGCISDPEKSWLLYRAAVSMLQLCCCSTYFDALTPAQFQALARVMTHDVKEVRMRFSRKLCKYLNSFRLPVWFSAILAYAFCEPSGDLKRSAEETLQRNFAARHAAITKYRVKERVCLYLLMKQATPADCRDVSLCLGNGRLYNLHPDYVLPHAVHLMAHDPEFTYHEDLAALSRIKMCLFFLMKPMFKSSPGLDVEFYVKLLTSIKQVRDRQNPSDEEAHLKLYAVCDVATGIVLSKAPASLPLTGCLAEPALPLKLYVVPQQLQRLNEETYLTKELCFTPPKNQSVDMSAYGLKLPKRRRVNREDLLRSESPGESSTTSLEDWESEG